MIFDSVKNFIVVKMISLVVFNSENTGVINFIFGKQVFIDNSLYLTC